MYIGLTFMSRDSRLSKALLLSKFGLLVSVTLMPFATEHESWKYSFSRVSNLAVQVCWSMSYSTPLNCTMEESIDSISFFQENF